MRHAAWALALWLCLALTVRAQELAPIPPLTARVTDTTGTLTAQQKNTLEGQLAAFESQKGAQLAVLIVPSTAPEEIEQYGIRAVEQWKLGRHNVDDGALLLIAKNDRRLRIEVGRGLEGALTDATSHRIISETITPFLRQGDFYGGVSAGVAAMMKVVRGEPLPPPDPRWGRGAEGEGQGLPGGLFFLVLIGSMVLTGLFGRGLGSVLTALGAGLLVATTGHALLLALVAGGGALFLSLLLSAGRGGLWMTPGIGGFHGRGGGFGGGFGGGGFGGGGFGGFSGGGGGFGGGGASGRW